MGVKTRFGNNVSFSERKTRRSFKPNAHRKRLHAPTLGKVYKVQVTTQAGKFIKKQGGFENFLLNHPRRIQDSKFGQHVREELISKIKADKYQAEEDAKSLELQEMRKTRPGAVPISNFLNTRVVTDFYRKIPMTKKKKR